MARQTFTTTIMVYDNQTRRHVSRPITLDYDLQAIAQWLGTRAKDSKAGKAMLMENALIARTDAAQFPTDRRVPVGDESPTFGKAREAAQAAGRSATIPFYLTGTTTGLSVEQARQLVAQARYAIARPQDKADWMVAYLDTKPCFPNQSPFQLRPHELP